MQIDKLKISTTKLDNNFLFYLFLKEMNASRGLSNSNIDDLLSIFYTYKAESYSIIVEKFDNYMITIKHTDKKVNMSKLLTYIENENILQIYLFALQLMVIKPMLLQEAKLFNTFKLNQASSNNLLSIKYDDQGSHKIYYNRVNGALLSLLFFDKLESRNLNFLTEDAFSYLEYLADNYHNLKHLGVEANQIFMLMFTESVNQSIKANAGISYEDRILQVLQHIGIDKSSIKKVHDPKDLSTEYDFFFKLDEKTIGISAKRTLRERYKQFIKTSQSSHIDLMIEITLGLDLSESMAKTIRQHNVYIFVSDEIYESRKFLQSIKGVYPSSALSLELLKSL